MNLNTFRQTAEAGSSAYRRFITELRILLSIPARADQDSHQSLLPPTPFILLSPPSSPNVSSYHHPFVLVPCCYSAPCALTLQSALHPTRLMQGPLIWPHQAACVGLFLASLHEVSDAWRKSGERRGMPILRSIWRYCRVGFCPYSQVNVQLALLVSFF